MLWKLTNEDKKPLIRRVLYQDSRWTQDGCFTKTQDGSVMLEFTHNIHNDNITIIYTKSP